jgi:hypothetical protein
MMETTTLGSRRGMEHKVGGRKATTWHYNPSSSAWYGWQEPDDDGTTDRSTGPAPSWDDGPALEKAKAAGRAALAAGFGPTSRPDGLLGCGHCVPCAYNRPDRCHHPLEKSVARAMAGQAQADRIAQAEAAMVEMQGVVWREEHRRQLAL